MPDELLDRLRRFHNDAFPQYREQFQTLVDEGSTPPLCLSVVLTRAWCPTC